MGFIGSSPWVFHSSMNTKYTTKEEHCFGCASSLYTVYEYDSSQYRPFCKM